MLWVSVASLLFGTLVGYLLIFVFGLPRLGFMMGYAGKYVVEIGSYSAILWSHGRNF